MEIYKKSFHNFMKHRLLAVIIPAFTLYHIMVIVVEYYEIIGQGYPVLEYTRRLLMIAPQILVLYLVISYEYFSEAGRNNLEETIEATGRGYTNKHKLAMMLVMFTILFLHYVCFVLFDIVITRTDLYLNGVQDAGNQGAIHIIQVLFLNFFMIGSIGILIGFLISGIKRRITAYATMMAVIFITSYLLNEVATLLMILTDYSFNLFEILDFMSIMPRGLSFSINNSFGFSMSLKRISIIVFWNALLLLVIMLLYSRKKKALKAVICSIICISSMGFYTIPISELDTSLNSKGSTMADQHYYNIKGYTMEEEAADFAIKEYKLDLDTRLLLKADVSMAVTESLEEYKFTLSHSYKVSEVCDQDGNPLKYKQHKDELSVYSGGEKITKISMKYEGASEAFYSNMQGINLPGNFPYYPVPGRKRITEDGQFMNNVFLDEKADFDLKIKSGKEIHTNLKKIKEGHYTGSTTGVSIYSGMYEEYTCDGITIVYPYLIGWNKEALDEIVQAVKKEYDTVKVFSGPNVNKQIGALCDDQIITTGYLSDLDNLRENY